MSQASLVSFGISSQPVDHAHLYRDLWLGHHYDNQAAKMLTCFRHAKQFNGGFVATKTLASLFSQYNARIKELRDGKLGDKHLIQTAIRRDNNGMIVPGFEYVGDMD